MALRLLAIDLALTKTGIAFCVPDLGSSDGIDTWTIDTERPRRLSGHEREVTIVGAIHSVVLTVKPDVVLLEDFYAPVPSKMGDGFFGLAYLHGVVRYYLADRAPLAVVRNPQIKIYATGNGGAKKADVMLAVERRYRHLVTIADDNQADAFALLAMGCEHYGHPLPTADGRPLPKTHVRALESVAWPTLNGATPESPAGTTATKRRAGRAGTTEGK